MPCECPLSHGGTKAHSSCGLSKNSDHNFACPLSRRSATAEGKALTAIGHFKMSSLYHGICTFHVARMVQEMWKAPHGKIKKAFQAGILPRSAMFVPASTLGFP